MQVEEGHFDFRKFKKLTINSQTLEGLDLIEFCLSQKEEHLKSIGHFLEQWMIEDYFISVQTSGSTGQPKSMKVEKKHMLMSAANTANYFLFQKHQTALLSLPVSYIAGKMMVIRALYSGLNLICIPPSSQPLKSIDKELKIDFAPFTPMQMHKVEDTNNIKTILLGGAAVDNELEEKCQMLNAAIYHGYGMTETLSHIALRRVNGKQASKAYQALNGIHFSVDEKNCLMIHASFLNQIIVTNDVVELLDSKTFIWKGRADFVINSGGIKLFPEEIERKINALIKSNFFIGSIPDPILGEKLCLFIEGEALDNESIKNIKEKMTDVLEKYEMPKNIYFIPSFSYTTSGKIKRKESQERNKNTLL